MSHHRRISLQAALLALAALTALAGCGMSGSRALAPRVRAGSAAAGPSAASSPASSPAALSTAAENARPGTRDWRVHKVGADHEIEGYTDQVSVLPGRSFRLFVSTTAKGFTVQAFRMGWYGGTQARLVWSSPHQKGTEQAAPKIDTSTNTVTAPWKPSLTVPTPDWPAGSYLLRLNADSGAQRYVPITVRSADVAGRLVVLNGTTTWQAYNLWGGYSLYEGPSGFGSRSRAVAFDRPYDKDGAVKFMAYEQPAIVLAERLGSPLAYTTDNDLHAGTGMLNGARGLLVLGHDEYWSTAMRDEATRARNAGVNIAFLGANEINRHIRFAATRLGPNRLVICYKGLDDPIGEKDPSEVTIDWRFARKPWPESELTGVFYECNPAEAAYVVYEPDHWLLAGTGVRKGRRFPGMVGPEYDRVNPIVETPRPIEIIAHSPVTCGGASSHADSAYYTVRSGAGVFAAGTMRWVCAMRGKGCGHGVTDAAKVFVDRVTETLLRAMAEGPVGRTHPAEDNIAQVKPYKGYPVVAGDDRPGR
ncbi:MAG TPA: N,N-dimethylformamidase beta subunit family domain-containing protein [Actinomadura sp.]|nr:N,N-dimethylformamidase beta subunit family domain-containing protein [Actinomadura sp.]